MTTSSKSKTMLVSLIVILIAIIAAVVLWKRYAERREEYRRATAPMGAEVINTPHSNATLHPPQEFPINIPIERENILESNTTRFPAQGAVQTSVTYKSGMNNEEVKSSYIRYMEENGYVVKESEVNGTTTVSGERRTSKITVSISPTATTTTVQVSHLLIAR